MFLIRTFISTPSGITLKIDEIKSEFSGIIIEKYSVRNTKPTHLKIKTKSNFIEICPNSQIVNNANVGDSLIKPKNENFVFLKKLNKKEEKFFYTRISKETRNHNIFPKEWKDKWLESSEWEK